LDAVIDWGTTAGSPGTFAGNPSGFDANGNCTLNSAVGSYGGVYRGPKYTASGTADPFAGGAATADDRALNNGLDDGLYNQICVYYLTADNVSDLRDGLGLRNVWYHNPTVNAADSVQAVNPDGTPVISGDESYGYRAERSPAYQTPLTAGTAVLAVDPLNGADIYADHGQPLYLSDSADDADALNAVTDSGAVLVLFGLGSQASIIGDSNGGISRAPRCEVLPRQYYRQYLLIVRLPVASATTYESAEIVGVLDPMGQTTKTAVFHNDWR
jgi:hypothetical protein